MSNNKRFTNLLIYLNNINVINGMSAGQLKCFEGPDVAQGL